MLFRDALSRHGGAWRILNLHGPGGMGKSTLLDAFRRLAEETDALYLYFDMHDLGVAPADTIVARLAAALAPLAPLPTTGLAGCIDALHQVALTQPVALVFDTFEEAGELQRWLRESLLPPLPQRTVIVVAGRFPLTDAWRDYPAWCELIHAIALTGFDHAGVAAYLRLHQITEPALVDDIWRYTGGQPLAVSLATTLVKREGPRAIRDIPARPELLETLTQRWLREVPADDLRELAEAAATVRRFDQELLARLIGHEVSPQRFDQLTALSFVRRHAFGWALHDLVRAVLDRNLRTRSPSQHRRMRQEALRHFCALATAFGQAEDRSAALHEFFCLLGDGLVRAALYDDEDHGEHGYFVERALPADLPALQDYFAAWRRERGVLAGVQVDLVDRQSMAHIPQWVATEPREPEFIQPRELLERFPGSIRMLRDPCNQVQGLSIVLPINANAWDYLASQAVTGPLLQTLPETERAEYLSSPATENWFVRLIDVRDPTNQAGRAVLFRDVVGLLIRPARFITSTPLPFYQELLLRFGFVESASVPPHFDFGADRRAPYYMLDLRGPRLRSHLQRLISQQFDDDTVGLDIALSNTLVSQLTGNPGEPPRNWLEQLTLREREVAQAAAEGLANCSIAKRLDISEITVKKHMSRIFEKLGVRNRAELVKRYWSGTN